MKKFSELRELMKKDKKKEDDFEIIILNKVFEELKQKFAKWLGECLRAYHAPRREYG